MAALRTPLGRSWCGVDEGENAAMRSFVVVVAHGWLSARHSGNDDDAVTCLRPANHATPTNTGTKRTILPKVDEPNTCSIRRTSNERGVFFPQTSFSHNSVESHRGGRFELPHFHLEHEHLQTSSKCGAAPSSLPPPTTRQPASPTTGSTLQNCRLPNKMPTSIFEHTHALF